MELGQSFARLGSQVTLIEIPPNILPREGADAAEVVADALRGDGPTLLTCHAAVKVEVSGGGACHLPPSRR